MVGMCKRIIVDHDSCSGMKRSTDDQLHDVNKYSLFLWQLSGMPSAHRVLNRTFWAWMEPTNWFITPGRNLLFILFKQCQRVAWFGGPAGNKKATNAHVSNTFASPAIDTVAVWGEADVSSDCTSRAHTNILPLSPKMNEMLKKILLTHCMMLQSRTSLGPFLLHVLIF